MRELGYEVQLQDVEVLMEFLSCQMPADSKLRPLSFNSVRNDTLEILLRQKELPDGMGELLTGVYNNPEQDDMWRNYCIQFMELYYERQAKESGVTNQLQSVQDFLWDALDERDNSNAGTALLALDKLSRNHDEFAKEEIRAAMIDLAIDEQASLANRVTALRLCGEQGNFQALEPARDLAANGNTTMIRCAAIATLGELGTEEDYVQLETYAAS